MSTPTNGSRSKRKTLVGFVSSRMGDKSVKVTIPYKTPHARYHKIINRKTVVHAHDEKNEAHMGDTVELMETRPISRLKRWRIVSIIERAKLATAQAVTEADVAASVPTKNATSASGATKA